MTTVPLVSFDNVLPAATVVLLGWGLRIRDGVLLATGYATTIVAAGSVVLLWWGGAELVRWLFASVYFARQGPAGSRPAVDTLPAGARPRTNSRRCKDCHVRPRGSPLRR